MKDLDSTARELKEELWEALKMTGAWGGFTVIGLIVGLAVDNPAGGMTTEGCTAIGFAVGVCAAISIPLRKM